MAEGEGTGRTGDRLKQLRAFCHAARLDIPQPVVSRHVRALEREFAPPFLSAAARASPSHPQAPASTASPCRRCGM